MNKKVQVWVVHEDEVLLLKVVAERGGGWQPITGGVDKGEKLLDCAKRETFEETGIDEKRGSFIELDFPFEYKGRWGRSEEHAFAFVLKKRPLKIKIDPKEHTDFCWMKIKKAYAELAYEKQKEALEKVECIRSKT